MRRLTILSQRQRHRLLQALFWNQVGAAVISSLVRYERLFDVVIRNYSLIGDTNGERWLLSLLDEAPIVFDVGFHDGASTREILRVRPNAQVTGFDPSRFALRSYNTCFANDSRVSMENLGLSNSAATLEFFDYDDMCNSLAPRKETMERPATYNVEVTTLDAYCLERHIDHVNFLKIDAEGFDLHVLEGGRDLLSTQSVDLFMFEFASGWAASKRYLWEVREYFDGLPYSLYRLFNAFLCPLVYDIRNDASCALSAMYVGVSDRRLARGGIPLRDYTF